MSPRPVSVPSEPVDKKDAVAGPLRIISPRKVTKKRKRTRRKVTGRSTTPLSHSRLPGPEGGQEPDVRSPCVNAYPGWGAE